MKKIGIILVMIASIALAQDEAMLAKKEALAIKIQKAKAQLSSLENEMKAMSETPKPKETFKTHTEMGYIGTSGNTDTNTFNLETKIDKKWGKHAVSLLFDGQYADDNSVESKNKYFIELNYNYALSDRLALSYLLGYKSDKFSSFDYQIYTGPGLKYKVIVSKKQNLSIEGNILYSMDRYAQVNYADAAKTTVIKYPNAANTPALAFDPSYSNDYAAYRTKAVYAWQILKNLKFDQEISYRGSFEAANQYFIYSKSAIASKISEMFSAGLSYKIDYVNDPGDKDSTDTTVTVNLIMDY